MSKKRRKEKRVSISSQHNIQEEVRKPRNKARELRALNSKQHSYIKYITDHSIIVGTGYPGTGKSYIPASMAATMLQDPDSPIKKIVICRPNVGVGKTIGLLPGDVNEKMKAWCAPIIDVLNQQLGGSFVDYLIKIGTIELLPLEFARGKSYDNTFIILDEAQNVDRDSLKCLLTRIGKNTKVVIDGDVGQCDIGPTSGLGSLLRLIEDYYTPMFHVDFSVEDIVRSDMCKTLIELFVESKF